MRNWSTDTSRLKKDPEKFEIWKLEQLVNYGLQGGRISKKLLKKHWDKVVIDKFKREYLNSLIHAS